MKGKQEIRVLVNKDTHKKLKANAGLISIGKFASAVLDEVADRATFNGQKVEVK